MVGSQAGGIIVVVGFVLASVFASPANLGTQQKQAGIEWLSSASVESTDLGLWLTAVEHHRPGTLDDATSSVARWSRRKLLDVLADFELRRTKTRSVGSVALNRVLERAAFMHADLAMLSRTREGYGQLPKSGTEASPVRDGRVVGEFIGTSHWEFGRALLDSLKAGDGSRGLKESVFARDWYRATSLFLAEWKEWSELEKHLDEGLKAFPADAVVLQCAGLMHEEYASPGVQAAYFAGRDKTQENFVGFGDLLTGARLNNAPNRRSDLIKSTDSELRQAEVFYRKALATEQSSVEVRIRLGRVLGLTGRHVEALRELSAAAAQTRDPMRSFWVSMFLGREFQALGRVAESRESYLKAAQLFPRAVSARLALSQIGWESGMRRVEADQELLALLQKPGSEREGDDPLDKYLSADSTAAVAALRNQAG